MPENPKEFLKQRSEGLGPVEQTPNGAKIAFKTSNGVNCALHESGDGLKLSPVLGTLGVPINLTRRQASQMVNTLQRWIKTGHLS